MCLAGMGINMEKAQAFALPLILGKLFLAYGFGAAAVEIYKTRSFREDVAGLGTAGSYDGDGRLMIPGGSQFTKEQWKVSSVDAHAMEAKRLYDGERIYPIDTTVSMSDQRDVDTYNQALKSYGLSPLSGSVEYRKRSVESANDSGEIMVAGRTKVLNSDGSYRETILPVVVAMRSKEPRLFPIRELT